jgi:hypothetical protein
MAEGPRIGHILQAVFEAKLDGDLPTRGDELEFARALAGGAGTVSGAARLGTEEK